jgi:alpha-ketoglutarate-dependent taurine dioxygenase
VDGFYCASELKARHANAFNVLCEAPITYRYLEKDRFHFRSTSPVIQTKSNGKLVQVKYNDYDRDPEQSMSHTQLDQFYRSLHNLAAIVQNKDSEFWIKLRPGTVVFIDNWRVLHGRSSFSGRRTMCGCYLTRDDWRNRARLLGVL